VIDNHTVYGKKSIIPFSLEKEKFGTGSACSNTGSIRDDPYLTSRKNSLELTELSSIKFRFSFPATIQDDFTNKLTVYFIYIIISCLCIRILIHIFRQCRQACGSALQFGAIFLWYKFPTLLSKPRMNDLQAMINNLILKNVTLGQANLTIRVELYTMALCFLKQWKYLVLTACVTYE
jgi:hypothetical protein